MAMVNRTASAVLLVWLSAVPLATAQSADPPPSTPAREQEPVQVAPESPHRGFASTLVHQLGTDLKRIPRRNSLYWLAGGTALALAVHPADDEINERLAGSDFADAFFAPGKVLGSSPFVLSAAAATYIWGRTKSQPRVRHLGMDLIESTILAEGLTQLNQSRRTSRSADSPRRQQQSRLFIPVRPRDGHVRRGYRAAAASWLESCRAHLPGGELCGDVAAP